MKELFTIGHSNHPLERFRELLAQHNISAVADVRSSPYSQYAPQFNKDVMEVWLRNAGVEYIFMGRELGARSSEESCYVGDQAKYELIAQSPVFKEGLDRVLREAERHRLALMCSEADPLGCHRTILVCRELKRTAPQLRIVHILADGTTETHEEAERRLVGLHKLQPELFGELTSDAGIINHAYELQAKKIEFRKEPQEK
jgi:uncharacterized protein (DUF488 family)